MINQGIYNDISDEATCWDLGTVGKKEWSLWSSNIAKLHSPENTFLENKTTKNASATDLLNGWGVAWTVPSWSGLELSQRCKGQSANDAANRVDSCVFKVSAGSSAVLLKTFCGLHYSSRSFQHATAATFINMQQPSAKILHLFKPQPARSSSSMAFLSSSSLIVPCMGVSPLPWGMEYWTSDAVTPIWPVEGTKNPFSEVHYSTRKTMYQSNFKLWRCDKIQGYTTPFNSFHLVPFVSSTWKVRSKSNKPNSGFHSKHWSQNWRKARVSPWNWQIHCFTLANASESCLHLLGIRTSLPSVRQFEHLEHTVLENRSPVEQTQMGGEYVTYVILFPRTSCAGSS